MPYLSIKRYSQICLLGKGELGFYVKSMNIFPDNAVGDIA